MGGDGGAHTAALPSEQVLRWVAGVVGGMRVLSVENPSRSTHRPPGTFRLRVEGTSTGATDLILKVSVPRWITDGMVITNARALRLAETHGLAAPRLIAADLDGSASGTVATLETFLSGSSDLPPLVSAARLREAGAAIARVNAVVLAPQADLPPWRAADDRAADRRRGRTPTTPLLEQADERVRSHGVPAAASVFLHGVDSYVSAHGRVLRSQGRRASIETGRERGAVLTELAGEAVHRPHTRATAKRLLQAGMLCNQSGYPRPEVGAGGKQEQAAQGAFDRDQAKDEACARRVAGPTVVVGVVEEHDVARIPLVARCAIVEAVARRSQSRPHFDHSSGWRPRPRIRRSPVSCGRERVGGF